MNRSSFGLTHWRTHPSRTCRICRRAANRRQRDGGRV